MTPSCDSRVTVMLQAIERGDSRAIEDLLPVVYEELRGLAGVLMAREKPGQTLQPTALVHEAYVRLVASEGAAWESRRHFFNAAAMVMRRALIDRARRKKTDKHGAGLHREPLDAVEVPAASDFDLDQMEAVDSALNALAAHNQRWAEIVHLRYFAGLTIEQTADALGVSPATVKSDWQFARAWLRWQIDRPGPLG